MSEEELDHPSRVTSMEEAPAAVLPQGVAGGKKRGGALGTAVMVGAGAVIAGRVFGGGLLAGIAGVVAGTLAGRAMARRDSDAAESGVVVDRGPLGEEIGAASAVVEVSGEASVVGELGGEAMSEEEVGEEKAGIGLDEEVVDGAMTPVMEEVSEDVSAVPFGLGELVVGDLSAAAEDLGEPALEVRDGAIGGEELGFEDLRAIYDEAVEAGSRVGDGEAAEGGDAESGVEEGDPDPGEGEIVEALEDQAFPPVEEVVEAAVEAEPEAEVESEVRAEAEVEEDVTSESESVVSKVEEREEVDVAVATEEDVDVPLGVDLTPDEIWELEALGRFIPAGPEAGVETADEVDNSVVGKGLFPARSELLGSEKDVALGASFFSYTGAFDDVDDEEAAEDPPAGSGVEEPETGDSEPLPWASLEVGGVDEGLPGGGVEQKPSFEGLRAGLGVDPVEGEAGFEAAEIRTPEQPKGDESAGGIGGVVEPVVDLVPLLAAAEPKKASQRYPHLRSLVFAIVVVTGMVGGAIALFSIGSGRPVMEWASGLFAAEERWGSGVVDGEAVLGAVDPDVAVEGVEPGMQGVVEVVEEAIPEAIPTEGEMSPVEELAPGEAGAEIEVLPALLSDDRVESEEPVGEDEGGLVTAGIEPTAEGPEETNGVAAIDPGDAKSVLMGFLRSDTVEQLLGSVHGGERVEKEIRSYYPDGRVPGERIEEVRLEVSATVPSTGRETHLFVVRLEGEGVGIPVSVEQTDDGYRVDWEAYVQCRDKLLARFAETGENRGASGGYYVVMKRSHYFKDDVPGLDGKLCFHLTSPLPGDPGVYVFVDKLSEEARALAGTMRWGALYFPVVRLSRVENPGGSSYLLLDEVVREQWRAN